MTLWSALLAAFAALVAMAAPSVPHRLRDLARAPASPVLADGLSPGLTRAVCLLAGLAAWALLGGLTGAVAGAGAALLGPRGLARLDADEDVDSQVAADLPLALDLLAACLAGGAVTADAVRAVAGALGGPCGGRLSRVAAALAVGSPPAEAWRALGEDRGPAGAAARALARAAQGGAPVAAAVQRIAEDARREAGGRAERAARRAGVLAVGPLGLCFLPAFMLIGVVPAVVGLAGPLLRSL